MDLAKTSDNTSSEPDACCFTLRQTFCFLGLGEEEDVFMLSRRQLMQSTV